MVPSRTIDVQDFITEHTDRKLSPLQLRTIVLCFLIVAIDGFDTGAIGFIAPALKADWQVTAGQLAPLFGAGLFGLMVGAFVIILDPIFQGLAVSLLFGVGASTLLTLFVIPLLYYRIVGHTAQSGRHSLETAMANEEAVTHRVQAEGVSV